MVYTDNYVYNVEIDIGGMSVGNFAVVVGNSGFEWTMEEPMDVLFVDLKLKISVVVDEIVNPGWREGEGCDGLFRHVKALEVQ